MHYIISHALCCSHVKSIGARSFVPEITFFCVVKITILRKLICNR